MKKKYLSARTRELLDNLRDAAIDLGGELAAGNRFSEEEAQKTFDTASERLEKRLLKLEAKK